jgi:hypothetical protein
LLKEFIRERWCLRYEYVMEKLITLLLALALFSCEKKVASEGIGHDSTALEKEASKALKEGSKLLGEWRLQLTCEGSLDCNICPILTFRRDGAGTVDNLVGGNQAMHWEVGNGRISITNIEKADMIDNGYYAYEILKDGEELKLTELTNTKCCKLTRLR